MDKKNKACAKIRFDSREEATHFANGMKITITNDLKLTFAHLLRVAHSD